MQTTLLPTNLDVHEVASNSSPFSPDKGLWIRLHSQPRSPPGVELVARQAIEITSTQTPVPPN